MKFILLSFTILFLSGLSSNTQGTKKEVKSKLSGKVEAYYFHLTNRCVTCKTVEAEAQKDLATLYGGKVSFQAINIENTESKAIVEKFQISGQTLLLVKGDTKINITNEGFMYARNNPEKFKSIIKEKVDGLLNL